MSSPLFTSTMLKWPLAVRKAKVVSDAFPDLFEWPADAIVYLRYAFTDRQGLWSFKPNAKTGTTSTMYFLFHLMFGRPLTAVALTSTSINEDQTGHKLATARVFSTVCDCGTDLDLLTYLDQTLRLTTVRHPFTRAVSGFTYLCRAHDAGGEQFVNERLRLCALTPFDWGVHPHTVQGFELYLDFLEQELSHQGDLPVNSHFGPQVLNILPQVFRPSLIGRCEDLPAFFTEIAARLDMPLPQGAIQSKPRNVQTIADRAAYDSPAIRDRVRRIFAADFETFGYDL